MSSLFVAFRPITTANTRRQLVAAALTRRASNYSSTDAASNKAADDAITVDGTEVRSSTLAAQCLQPRPIFPWRSSPDPLQRLVKPTKPTRPDSDSDEDEIKFNARIEEYYESDYFTKGGPLGPGWVSPCEPWFRGALYCNSMYLLGLSWPRILVPWTRRDWEHDMEWAFCNAFSNGVNGMIQDTYVLPQNDTADTDEGDSEADAQDDEGKDSYDVDLNLTLEPLPLEERSDEGGESNNKRTFSDREEEENSMLQGNLRQLYQSAKKHSHPSKVNIVLRTVPKSARIESMFPVFGLSRSLVEDHPNLRHTYRNLLKRLQAKHKEAVLAGKNRLNPIEVGTFIFDGMQEVMERAAKLSGDGKAAITIVAQVSIDCKEIFCVRDVESGEIIQGHGDPLPRDVTHLVRFEMVVTEKLLDIEKSPDGPDEGDWDLEIGRWQITDWDDLLDGNVFFT